MVVRVRESSTTRYATRRPSTSHPVQNQAVPLTPPQGDRHIPQPPTTSQFLHTNTRVRGRARHRDGVAGGGSHDARARVARMGSIRGAGAEGVESWWCGCRAYVGVAGAAVREGRRRGAYGVCLL
jgi:hypothetical protein